MGCTVRKFKLPTRPKLLSKMHADLASVPHLVPIPLAPGVGRCGTCPTLSTKFWHGAVGHCSPNCGNVGSGVGIFSLGLHYISISPPSSQSSCPFGLLLLRLPTSPPCKLQIFPRSCPLVWRPRPCICAPCTGTPVGGKHRHVPDRGVKLCSLWQCTGTAPVPIVDPVQDFFQFSAFQPLTEAVGGTF